MKLLYATILILGIGTFFATAEELSAPLYPQSLYGDVKEETSAPAGLITVIRENGAWRFKVSAGSSGWNYSSSLDKAILNGESFSIPVSTAGSGLAGGSFVNLTITDEMAKTATLELWYSYTGRGGNRATRYTIKISELIK